jgi:hypothetical protein
MRGGERQPKDRSYVPCPHCRGDKAELLRPLSDRGEYRCPNCREFSISRTQQRLFDEGIADPTRAWFVEGTDGRRYLKG